jgi:hypothetical protein
MFALSMVILFSSNGFCDMSSANYSVPVSVFPGGDVSMSSANYEVKATLGQPSPPRKDSEPTESANYVLYPGFWYTLDAVKEEKKAMPWVPLLLLDD